MDNETERVFPWGDSRRFNSYSAYFKRLFGGRVQKISINAGFTCPNRDGNISTGGCSFCNNDAFNPSYCKPTKTIREQIEEGIVFHQKRYRRAESYLAYFQAFSNTYKSLDELRSLYYEAIGTQGIKGIVIGTRPDLINDDILTMLTEIQKTHYVMLEYGVESVYDDTLRHVNRGHDFATAENAIRQTASHGIPCGAHLIFGLPGETIPMMLDTASIISRLPLDTVKFHQLQIFKDTPIAQEYEQNPDAFHIFNLDEYIDFVIDFAERMSPGIVIERFAGEVPPRYLVTEPWLNLRYDEVLCRIEKRMEERDTWQGKLFNAQ